MINFVNVKAFGMDHQSMHFTKIYPAHNSETQNMRCDPTFNTSCITEPVLIFKDLLVYKIEILFS